MQLVLSEDQELLAKTAADFAARHSPVARVRELRERRDPDGFSRELWRQMAELGWVGIPYPEAQGGAGLGFAELAVVMEALGRALAPEPFLSSLLAGQALRLGGSDAQRERWLPALLRGERLLALAHQEPRSRHERFRVATRAEAADGGWRLRGEKTGVLDGASADALVVAARTAGDGDDPRGIALFLVPRDASGLAVERQQRVDSRNAALVRLDGVPVGRDDLVGDEDGGGALLDAAIDRATSALCAEMLGSMSEACDRTLHYLKVREQFGVPIGSFQALKHRAAQLFIEIELCRSVVMAAARAVDEADEASGDEPDPGRSAALVSLAKARCSETAMLVAHEAIQMHGGIGMTDEHEIGFFLKRARVAEQTFGDAAWHRDRWARLGGY